MSLLNRDVIVQTVNRPDTRHIVGYLSDGYAPELHDLERWGVADKVIVDQSWRIVRHRTVYMIVVA